jgi:hypothetical protein
VPYADLVKDAACGTGAQRRLVLDEIKHGAMLVEVGAITPPQTAASNRVVPVTSAMEIIARVFALVRTRHTS